MMTRLILLIACCALLPGAAQSEDAAVTEVETASATEENTGVSRILGALQWGTPIADVLKSTEERMRDDWQGRLKELDTIGVDHERRLMRQSLAKIKNSLVRFDGGATGFESSLIGREMVVGKNESMLSIPEGGQQRFYFFRNDRLWKIVVYMDAIQSPDFAGFVKQMSADLGQEAQRSEPPQSASEAPIATWRDEKTVAVAESHVTFFSAYLLRFYQAGDGETFQAERSHLKLNQTARVANEDVDDLFAADDVSGADETDDNVVDLMTGSGHDVDLSVGDMDNQMLTETPGNPPKKKSRSKRKARQSSGDAVKKTPKPKSEKAKIIY